MTPPSASQTRSRWIRLAILSLVFALTLLARVRDIDRHFWMLEDQIRDWSIALGSFADLPLVGPPTHVHGYTIGPAFYWILWVIRVLVGPWFQNLPHAGGIGQAMLQSLADTILMAAVWRRTKSLWIALATVVLVATAAYDLCLSALVWNPMVGSALAKIATALVLAQWPERSAVGVTVAAAVAWCAVQSYTGTIFVAVSVFTALLAGPLSRRNWQQLRRNAAIITIVIAVLQVPYTIHQLSTRFTDSGMSAVAGSVGEILSGREQPAFAKSWAGYVHAFDFILVEPWHAPWALWVLVACGVVVASRFRHDVALLSVTLLPPVAAVVGYALYVGDFLDSYYYLSLMPAAVLTVMLSVTALRPPALRVVASVVLLAIAVTLVPARLAMAATLHRMPEYGVLVDGSRELVRQQRPVQAITTQFTLPPTADPVFIYQILGGQIDRSSPWIAVIQANGHVAYREAAAP